MAAATPTTRPAPTSNATTRRCVSRMEDMDTFVLFLSVSSPRWRVQRSGTLRNLRQYGWDRARTRWERQVFVLVPVAGGTVLARRAGACAAGFGSPPGRLVTWAVAPGGVVVPRASNPTQADSTRLTRGEHQVPDQAHQAEREAPAAQQVGEVIAEDRHPQVPRGGGLR